VIVGGGGGAEVLPTPTPGTTEGKKEMKPAEVPETDQERKQGEEMLQYYEDMDNSRAVNELKTNWKTMSHEQRAKRYQQYQDEKKKKSDEDKKAPEDEDKKAPPPVEKKAPPPVEKKAPPPVDTKKKVGDKGAADLPAPATIIVLLPADARLTIDGEITTSTSARRVFLSPALRPGQQYQYTLQAEVVRQGQPVRITRVVPVQAGATTQVSLEPAAGTPLASR